MFTSGPTIYTTRDGIHMTEAGMIRAIFPRRPQNGRKFRHVTVGKARTGRYYAYVLYESPVQPPELVLPVLERILGLRYSLHHFYVDDQGSRVDPPHWLKQSQKKLVHLQRRLNRMQPGSKNYEEAALKYRLLHEHITSQRRDFLHKESRRVADAQDAVYVRGDDLDAMTDTLIQVGSAVKGAGFGMFQKMLYYELTRQGGTFIQVDRYLPTTRSYSTYGLTRDTLHAQDYRRGS